MGDNLTSLQEERQCWICLESESEEATTTWVSPCSCKGGTKWVHEACLLSWIDEKQKGNTSKLVKCPQCRAEYVVMLPRTNATVVLVDLLNGFADVLTPYFTIAGAICCGYVFSVTLGFYAVIQMLGPEDSLPALADIDNSFMRMYIGLPMIPVSLIASRFSSFDYLLVAIPPLIFYDVPLRFTLPPSPALSLTLLPMARIGYNYLIGKAYDYVRSLSVGRRFKPTTRASNASLTFPQASRSDIPAANSEAQTDNTGTEGGADLELTLMQQDQTVHQRVIRNPMRLVLGALLLPTISSMVGNLFLRHAIKDSFTRSLVGGCLFVVAKDLLGLFYTYHKEYQKAFRRVVSRSESRRHVS